MNSNGLLSKNAFLSTDLQNPVSLYKTASNSVLTLAKVYIATLPTISGIISLYISKMNILPNPQDLVLTNKDIYGYNGTLITEEFELAPNESIFVKVSNCQYCNTTSTAPITFSFQVRGLTEIAA